MTVKGNKTDHLLAFSSSLLECKSLDEIYELTTKFLLKRIHCRIASLFLFTKEGVLERKCIAGIEMPNLKKEVHKRGKGFIGKTAETPNTIGEAKIYNDVQGNKEINCDAESQSAIKFIENELKKNYTADEKIQHILTVPLNTPTSTFGVLCLFNKLNLSNKHHIDQIGFTERDKNVVSRIGNYTSLALSNKLRQIKLDNIANIFHLIKVDDEKLIYKKFAETLINDATLFYACVINKYNEEKCVFYPVASAGNFERLESARKIEKDKGIIGTTFKSNKINIIANIEEDPIFLFPDWAKKNRFISMICIPLRYLDETPFGTVSLFTKFKYSIDDAEQDYLNSFLNQVAFLIQDIKDKKELKKVKQVQQILHDISAQKGLGTCLEIILKGTITALSAEFGYIALFTKDSKYIKPSCLSGLEEENFPEVEIGKKGIAGWVYNNKKTYKFPSIAEIDNLYIPYKNFDFKIESEIACPLLYDNHVVGVLNISSTRKNAFNIISTLLIETITNETSIIIQNKKFYNAALKLGEVRFDTLDREKISMVIARKASEIIETPVTCVWLKVKINDQSALRMTGFEGISSLDKDIPDIYESSGGISWQAIKLIEEQINFKKLEEININREIGLSKEIDDIQNLDSLFLHKDFAKMYGLVSMLSIPLINGNEVIGVINTYTKRKYKFMDEEKLFLQDLSVSGSIALKNAELAKTIEADSQKIANKVDEISELNSKILDIAQVANPGIIAMHIAHDIKNSLLGVMNADISQLIDILPENKRNLSETKQLIESIAKKTDNLKDLIDKFIKPKMRSFSYKNEDILEIIMSVFAIYENNLARYKIRQEIKFRDKKLMIMCDKNQLEQVFFNLINNSIFALRQKQNFDRIIRVSVRKMADTDDIEVAFFDNGIGIKQENIDKIFDLHFSTKDDGSGVGLAICKRVIKDNHNGSIEVNSEYGKQTTFIIKLPIDKNKILYGNRRG